MFQALRYTSSFDIQLQPVFNSVSAVRLLVCGSRNVGKSTLARYALNNLLNKHPAVLLLDCDVGQTEFAPPGVVSLVLINRPILSPQFSCATTTLQFCRPLSLHNSSQSYIFVIGLS